LAVRGTVVPQPHAVLADPVVICEARMTPHHTRKGGDRLGFVSSV
jgi:hypothetical protein